MKPEKQVVAIAQTMGWERSSESPLLWHNKTTGYRFMALPDYLHDLNAMHEVEKTLFAEQWDVYFKFLKLLTDDRFWGVATAAQRAEAYLKALNLWKL